MREVVIVGAARTPIGDFLGSLKDLSAVELAKIAVKGALDKAKIDPSLVEDVVGGMIYKAGVKGNPARQVQLGVGIPLSAAAVTVDQQCGSAMRAFEIASQQIMLGKSDISVAFGTESMSRAPYLLMGAREGLRMGDGKIVDSMLHDGLVDAMWNYHMGVTAENLA
ncbi:MAG TPA: acetyl-CoA C-acetyltransferase, partial [Clostridia bacterium]|nr:acetyl-CoA C-acetyltransferase [Clostridia bacterium]